MDITKLRDDIANAEQAVESLKSQNGAIRSQLAGGGDQGVVPMAIDAPPLAIDNMMDPAYSTLLAPRYTVSIDMPDYLGTPVYQVRRASSSLPDSSSSKTTTSPLTIETFSGTTPASTVDTAEDIAALEATLSEEQIDRAINFILAYEPHFLSLSTQLPFIHVIIPVTCAATSRIRGQ